MSDDTQRPRSGATRRWVRGAAAAIAVLVVLPAAGAAEAAPPVYTSLAAAFDNVGTSTSSTFMSGSIDGGGQSYSQELLQRQAGLPGQTGTSLTPGATFSHDGLTFTWPSAAGTGTPDNVVASGETIALAGSGSTLGFVGTSDYGSSAGSGTVTYTDGTTSSYDLEFRDWWVTNGSDAGADVVARTAAFWTTAQAVNPQQVDLYAATVPINPAKTVASVTLPNVSAAAIKGSNAMHVFAMAIGTPAG